MKRDHQDFRPEPPSAAGKGKMMWVEEDEVDGMDELLAVLGYKVRTSDMADVALKLEQLEDAMMFNGPALLPYSANDSTGFANTGRLLPDDTVHYNPSDLSTWLESMLSELNPQPSDYDLKTIPGTAALSAPPQPPPAKRPKPSTSEGVDGGRPVVLVDSQENGVRLVHMLLGCAEAVETGNLGMAEALATQIGVLAAAQAGAMGKVATYFADALVRRIYQNQAAVTAVDRTLESTLLMHFYESGPYLKFAHFTANQAILEAFEGKSRVHVIDFSMNQGMQWPALMQALALRPGGPPSFRLTGIGPPASDNSDHLQEVGWKLAQLAETIHVEFEYRGFVAGSLADLDADILELRPGESVAVNSVLELHRLLARPGALEKVLSVVRRIKPEIFTVVEQEASHNGPQFLGRFTESLHYYSTLFDSLDSAGVGCSEEDRIMSEMYLGRQISNVVGCEGSDRVERHERLADWKNRLGSAGFDPVCLGSNAFKQASMLLSLVCGGDGYQVEESDGCLLLGWHTRPLIGTSAWRVNSAS